MVRLSRTFSVTLQDCCFASSFAAGLDDEDFDEGVDEQVPISEYAALSKQAGQNAAEEANPRKAVSSPSRSPLPGLVRAEGTSSFAASVANVTKSLVGIGMLTLPRALADGTPALGVMVLFLSGSLSALSFFMLGYCAHLTGAESLPHLWDVTVGHRSAFVVELVIFTDTLLSCIAFALLIGDYTSKSVGGLFPSIPEQFRSHGTLVMAAGVVVLLPLCMVRRLSLLRFSSLGGLICTLYVFFYVVGDFSSSLLSDSGEFEQGQPVTCQLSIGGLLRSTAIFAVAFMAHCNAPAFYADLRDRSPSRFAAVSVCSFGAAFLIYMAFGISGLGRFGNSVPGNALAAYPLSKPVLLMWLGMGLCIIASFPLVFAALRTATLRLGGRLCGQTFEHGGPTCRAVTVVMVLAIASVGSVLEDLSAVVSLCGALSGLCLAMVFPGAIMLAMRRRKTPRFKAVARSLVCLGTILAVASSVAVLSKGILGA
mmetsp:Transcript_32670/g.88502  ORF Transcript_32670/g.88502 Transcript_32670/m.88502 type:complete len:482 (-) Transcript_32670:134-1579(-)